VGVKEISNATKGWSIEQEEVNRLLSAQRRQETPLAHDLEAPPNERVKTTVSRIVRDTELANRVKIMHNYECQICRHTITLPDGSRYAEAHHIRPLGRPHNGPDRIENIVCLCPNHHAACDLGALTLDQLRDVAGHSISREYIDYHNQKIFSGRRV
jgi:predicted restriction endonuclease